MSLRQFTSIEDFRKMEKENNVAHYTYISRQGSRATVYCFETLELLLLAGGSFIPVYIK
jgi:hypothetical protein